MLKVNQYLLTTLVAIVGQFSVIPHSYAGPNHTSSAVTITSSPVTGSNTNANNNLVLTPESIGTNGGNTNGTGGNAGFTLSPEIIQAANEASINNSGNQSATNGSSLETGNSDALIICSTNDCGSGDGEAQGISLQKLAKILEEDLQNSLNNLAELEQQQDLADAKPRRFSRRRIECDCGDSLVRAREEVKEKTAQYQEIIDLADQLNPQNNKW